MVYKKYYFKIKIFKKTITFSRKLRKPSDHERHVQMPRVNPDFLSEADQNRSPYIEKLRNSSP